MGNTAPTRSDVKYWVEHDENLDLWTVKVTHKGKEVFVSVGATRRAVMGDAIRYFAELRRDAA